MLFLSVAMITAYVLKYTKENARQILVVGVSDTPSSNQKSDTNREVFKKSTYKGGSRSFIDTLPKFLWADPLQKR